jgi:hypothetical protein
MNENRAWTWNDGDTFRQSGQRQTTLPLFSNIGFRKVLQPSQVLQVSDEQTYML